MAKLYGQLIGQPVQTLQSGVALMSVPPVCQNSADQLLWRDMATTGGNVAGDTVSLGIFRPTAILDVINSQMWFGAIGGTSLSFGDATHPAGLRAVFVNPGGATPLVTPTLAAQIIAPLWQRLGYAANPGVSIELLATFSGVNPANGPLGWQIFGRNV